MFFLKSSAVGASAVGTTASPAESDPSGKSANSPGAKLDAGKPRVGLCLTGFMLGLQRLHLHIDGAPGAPLPSPYATLVRVTEQWPRALAEVAEVTTQGARKYTPGGWASVENGVDRYLDAYGRHLLSAGRGERRDDGQGGTGCLHSAQQAWNLLAVMTLWDHNGPFSKLEQFNLIAEITAQTLNDLERELFELEAVRAADAEAAD